MANRCCHGIAYSPLETISTAMCLQKMASASEIPSPDNIQPLVSTSLAWDNIDRLEETLSGEGTSHRVNGIAVQARHFGPQLPPDTSTQIVKTKKEGSRHWMHKIFPFTMQESVADLVLEDL